MLWFLPFLRRVSAEGKARSGEAGKAVHAVSNGLRTASWQKGTEGLKPNPSVPLSSE